MRSFHKELRLSSENGHIVYLTVFPSLSGSTATRANRFNSDTSQTFSQGKLELQLDNTAFEDKIGDKSLQNYDSRQSKKNNHLVSFVQRVTRRRLCLLWLLPHMFVLGIVCSFSVDVVLLSLLL
jgi:hypothetical protein